jgi:hypothetical protein
LFSEIPRTAAPWLLRLYSDIADIAASVDTTGTLSVALICPSPLPNKSSPVPNQQGDLDVDANGNIIEKPPIKIFIPKNLAPPVLSKKTRAPRK